MTEQKIKVLLEKYAKGTCSPEEQYLLELWFEKQNATDQEGINTADMDRIWKKINEASNPPIPKPNYIVRIAAAAILLCSMGLAFSLWRGTEKVTSQTTIEPGENKATLTLSDGRQILLSDNTIEIAEEQGISITKTLEGLLRYKIDPSTHAGKGYHMIETPRGGQYEILLPDGTLVMLNAASSIRFAVDMHLQSYRTVELKGEGYFEVAKDPERPFIVKSNQQEIKVLGTIFNVNSYEVSRNITTLLEGSILINQQQKLKPNQQAKVERGSISVQDVDAVDFVDWKNKVFAFKNENLTSIMARLSRWYDIDYIFEDPKIGNITFSGEVSRYENVEEILKLLKMTSKLKFEIQAHTIIIKQ